MKQLILLLLVFSAQPALAAELDQSMDKLCTKMKGCSLAQLEKQGLGGDMINTMSAMFDGMCKGWLTPYANSVGEAGLEDKAEACIDSMIGQSCEQLLETQGEFTSKACEEFTAQAEEAGVLGTEKNRSQQR